MTHPEEIDARLIARIRAALDKGASYGMFAEVVHLAELGVDAHSDRLAWEVNGVCAEIAQDERTVVSDGDDGPLPPVRLEVGYVGLKRHGGRVEIASFDKSDPRFPYVCGDWRYSVSGKSFIHYHLDIIAPWSDDPADHARLIERAGGAV